MCPLDDIIDRLLDQDDFEIDKPNRSDGDTPLHCAIRWINSEPPAQRPFGSALVTMMLEAGSSTRVRNKARLLPIQLVDPSNRALRDLIQKHEYAELNAGDFVNNEEDEDEPSANGKGANNNNKKNATAFVDVPQDDSDDDAEFSGSDEEERAEWERRRKTKGR